MKTNSLRTIAFITDIHLGEQFPIENNVNTIRNFESILADIEKRQINEIIFGGDIGEPTAHEYFFEKLKNFTVNVILGNHDDYENVKTYYKKDKKELFYKHGDEHYQYMFLDTSSEELSISQIDWLKNELNPTKELVLFIHHPVLEINTRVDKLYPLKNRSELKEILLSFKNKVSIFCGHYHMNDEQTFKNIKQYITQSMSYQLVKNVADIQIDNKNFGYRIIKIQKDIIETELINFQQ